MPASAEPENVKKIVELISPRASPEFRVGVLEALGQVQVADAGTAIVRSWSQFTPAA